MSGLLHGILPADELGRQLFDDVENPAVVSHVIPDVGLLLGVRVVGQ